MANKTNEFNYLIVYNYLKDGIQTISTIENQDEESTEIILPSNENPENILIKKQNYQNLSNEAKEVINIILNSPQEVMDLFLTPKKREVSISRLKTILTKSWKSALIVESAFKEISKWVKRL